MLIYIVIAALLVIMALLFVHYPISFIYSFKDKARFIIKIAGIPIYRYKDKKNEKTKEHSGESVLKKVNEFSDKWESYKEDTKELLMYLSKKIKIDELDVSTEFGFEEAAITGIVAGGVYTLCYTVISAIDNTVGIKNIKINIKPCFTQTVKRVYVKSGFSSSVFHIIRIVIMVNNIINKNKGGV